MSITEVFSEEIPRKYHLRLSCSEQVLVDKVSYNLGLKERIDFDRGKELVYFLYRESGITAIVY